MEYLEKDCIFTHEGKSFKSGGAFVSPGYAIGYPKFDQDQAGAVGVMNDWHGNKLGTARIVSCWETTPRRYISPRMYQIEATIDGVTYTGRGGGSGMIWRGKAKRG